jgi:hypothetical protein
MSCIEAINREAKSYERFISRISVAASGCWEMDTFHDRNGYAQFHRSKNLYKAHRISYEWHKGKILAGLTVDHLCENKGCVNPEHLEAVTREENGRRHNAKGYKKWWVTLSDEDRATFVENVSKKASQVAAAKKLKATHCRRGHEWKPDTTYIVPASGHRRCNVCFAEVQKRVYVKQMAKKSNNIK